MNFNCSLLKQQYQECMEDTVYYGIPVRDLTKDDLIVALYLTGKREHSLYAQIDKFCKNKN